jgi:hypothetical protein
VQFHPPALVGFAGGERYAVDVFVHAHQRKAQVGFARIAFGVAIDQRCADPVAHQRTGRRVQDGSPHHEAGYREDVAGDVEGEVARQHPQHAAEGDQQDQRLQQADAEVGRQLAQVARVLMHALIRIGADRPGIGEPECALRLHPMADQVANQALAQLELERLAQPALRYIQHQQDAWR